jgi:superfamily II helicase
MLEASVNEKKIADAECKMIDVIINANLNPFEAVLATECLYEETKRIVTENLFDKIQKENVCDECTDKEECEKEEESRSFIASDIFKQESLKDFKSFIQDLDDVLEKHMGKGSDQDV